MKVYIETFGCQMNEYDSERIIYHLEKKGYTKTPAIEESDIILINTCAVREKAENRLFGHLGNLKNLKAGNRLICVGGCSAQSRAEKLQERFPFVDIVFGTHNISQLPQLIDKRLKDNKKVCSVPENGFDYRLGEAKRESSFQALVPVSIGCNNFCSYCIVPYVRGREKSIEPEMVIETVKKLISEGVIQVTLLGQNVNSYGNDLENDIDFSYLLKRVSEIKNLERIRFMTSHPKDISLSLIKTIAERDNIMSHVHLPLQAGSDRVLHMMNRKYTREKYLEIVNNIRENIKNCSITTDIIVGFPGEEEKDFNDTLDIIERVGFNRAFTFIYSPRKGTSAAEIKDDISLKEKKKWFESLISIQNRISYNRNAQYVGKMFKVLIEGFSPKNREIMQGRMEDNTLVLLDGTGYTAGSIIDVKITEAKTFYVRGKIA